MLASALALTSAEPVALAGTHQTLSGTTAVWQIPPSPRALLFLAHGCNHRPTDFWPPGEACPLCAALPEEERITRHALHAGIALIAMAAADTDSRCWDFEQDGPAVKRALQMFVSAHAFESLPISALGASSGGAFVLQLPQLLPLHTVVSQIMAIPPSMLTTHSARPFPSTLFIHMKRDERTAALAKRCVRKLAQDGVQAAEIEHAPLRVEPRLFLRISGMDLPTATRLHQALQHAQLLDDDGFLLQDPRRSHWRSAVIANRSLWRQLPGVRPGEHDTLQPDESPVAEVLNVAWAMHEITSDHNRAILHWIVHGGHGKPEL
ncbi:hypothetical protein AB1Y20_011705 [Prymnesium parvum]|uniref:Uncharacterized protein n=1 Tax=Prymnesium parvum TaxID=97485 RepID=A0AB34IK60_PRYPA